MSDMNFDVSIRAHNDSGNAFVEARQQLTSLQRASDSVTGSVTRQSGAMRANAQAAKAMEAAHRVAAFRQRMLAVQGLDVAQSLALGIPPMQVAIQQGGQLAGIYAGQGGVVGAFKEATSSILGFARGHPVLIAATVALAGATIGLRADIEETTGVAVGFGDVFTATIQEIAGLIQTVAGPAISALGGLFTEVSRGILAAVKLVGNSIINVFEFAYRAVLSIWEGLPAALGDLALSAVQRVVQSLNPLLNQIGLDGLDIANPFSGAASALGSSLSDDYEVFGNDRIGGHLENISANAVQLALSTQEAAEGTRALSQAASESIEPFQLMQDGLTAANDNIQSLRQVFTGFFQNFSQQIQQGASVWDAFKSAGLEALNQITNKLLDMSTSNLFAGLFGGGGSGGLLSGLFGSFGLPSFDGGGFTGGGARSGGVDGRGGFPAILHPNETVLDHTRSRPNSNQPRSTTLNLNMNLNGSVSQAELAQATQTVLNVARQEMPSIAIGAVTQTNRRQPGLI